MLEFYGNLIANAYLGKKRKCQTSKHSGAHFPFYINLGHSGSARDIFRVEEKHQNWGMPNSGALSVATSELFFIKRKAALFTTLLG